MTMFNIGDTVWITDNESSILPVGSVGTVVELPNFLGWYTAEFKDESGERVRQAFLEEEIELVDLAKVPAPQTDHDVLVELLTRLAEARTQAGDGALGEVVEALAVGFLMDGSPEAKAVVRTLVLGVSA